MFDSCKAVIINTEASF
uniref:Uncharacterized protein n=1 Tax=Rhizophora mucronata TaxID=61149 RepID=A0A2P2Q035_RHIMU